MGTSSSMAAGLCALAAVLVSSGSLAASPCGVRAEIVAGLGQRYGEETVAIGLTSEGALLEVLASGDGGTWTIIQTAPSGLACMLAAGESWQPRGAPPGAADGRPPQPGDPAL